MADSYTTDELVRREAGFENNANIRVDKDITPKTNAANAEVESAVSSRYSTPLSNDGNYLGSQAEFMLKQLATSLGACLVMKVQYEGAGGSTYETAEKRCAAVLAKLDKLRKGEIKLIGLDGSELGVRSSGSSGIYGFPNSSDPVSGNPPIMTIDKIF